MLEILKLIRLRTIAFTAFTMYAMRFFVVQPVLEKAGFALRGKGLCGLAGKTALR